MALRRGNGDVTVRAPPPDPDELASCDREAIHIPGSIQPHGTLLVLSSREDAVVRHVSRNFETIFGVSIQKLIGRRLSEHAPDIAKLLTSAHPEMADQSGNAPVFLGTTVLDTVNGPRPFDAAAHRIGPLLALELEEGSQDGADRPDILYGRFRAFVDTVRTTSEIEDLCAAAAREVRRITGFDRVLVYRFGAEWSGAVIAEDRNDVLPSYLDLRFPASDIPAQARELYRRNRLRIIPDASYAPVPIDPVLNEVTGSPLDLSDSLLRSVSPVHVEYMRNMGTMASMSVSILVEGQLWGLISCHHKSPRLVPLTVRNACDVLTQVFALQLAARQRAADTEQRLRLVAVQARLLGFMAEEERFIDGLLKHPDDFLSLCAATGAAVVSGEHRWSVGQTPSDADVQRIVQWLGRHHREDVYATDALASEFPEAESFADRASGLLAISISKVHTSYVLWFRPEVVRTVKWGGDPSKPVTAGSGPTRLNPRTSFETWKETVRGRSLAWTPPQTDAAKELRNSIVGIVLRRAEELASLNEELQRSNTELEAFSYSVSHDLRAPFRHIVGYAELLRGKKAAALDDQARRYVDTIIASAISAGALVDHLLSFSQMGRAVLNLRDVDMNALVGEVRQGLEREQDGRKIEWRLGELGAVHADPAMMRLVVENLLSNAVKYTRKREAALIEIGARREANEIMYFVRDNGAGFDMAYVGKLFGVFQRLHRAEDFEGTGIGLANVRRIVERHGGRTWAEGAVDRGATFFFALPAKVR